MPVTVKMLLVLLAALALSASMPIAESAEKPARASTTDYDSLAQAAIETVTKFVEADTTNLPGNEARIARIVAKKLDAAGIAYEITEFAPGRENIVARLKSTHASSDAPNSASSAKPIMLLAHEDVVTAEGQAWTVEPHKVTRKDGYLYGRGIYDDLGMAALNVETFIYLKKSGAKLRRDVILALTGDEESGGSGIQYLIKNKPESVNASIALNEGGHVVLDPSGKAKMLDLSAAEKTYQDFELVAKGTTGHASMPRKDNAIHRLARALNKVESHPPTDHLIPVTRAYFKGRATLEKPPLSKAMFDLAHSPAKGPLAAKALKIVLNDPTLAPLLHTTCTPTTQRGGTRVNALPAEAAVNLNCRILPDESIEQIKAWLEKTIADPEVKVVNIKDQGHGPASPLDNEAPQAIEKITHQMWPGLPIVPSLMKGASDSRFLRNAGVDCYGIDPLPVSDEDYTRMHGIDERVRESSFRTGIEYLHRLVIELAGA